MQEEIRTILENEEKRQSNTVELIASENFASDAVRYLSGSVFTNKYAEGYPGKRYYNGCEYMDEIESLAIDSLCQLYGSSYANVQPHCGANANTAVYLAFLKPGDRILGMDLSAGGHLSHGAPVNLSGKWFEAHSYGVDENGFLNMEKVRERALKVKPHMIVAGGSAYPRQIDWWAFRNIADEVGALLLVDMSHTSGLIATRVMENPIPPADVVTSTTHKTLRGPRGGVILWNREEYTRKINSAVFPGSQGGPLMNQIAAKAQAFHEAMQYDFALYGQNVVLNAIEMCKIFSERGYDLVTGGTDSHLLLVDLRKHHLSGREAADRLEENGITVNKNSVPGDSRSFVETSGIRIGTAAMTTRGYLKSDFRTLTHRICDILDE